MRIGIIGAGPAGITAAYCLARAGVHVEVFEASGEVGGLARSFDLWGQKVDLGPHRFFSNIKRVNDLWLEVVGTDYHAVNRLTRIYYKGRYFRYPLQAFNAFWNMGPAAALACVMSYGKQKALPDAKLNGQNTFESWVVQRFGRRLFEMFFKSYSEKLWGIPCDELDADFAAQRIKKFSLGAAMLHALKIGAKRHKTLVDQFMYPVGGTGMVYERMAQKVTELGGEIHLRTPVKRVMQRGNEVYGLELADGTQREFDHVISTMPLTLLVKGLAESPPEVQQACEELKFRNTILVYLHVDEKDLFPDQWLYIHSADLKMGRVTNFRNWVPELYGDKQTSILALEYWCNDDDADWTESDEALIERATIEIRQTGLIGNATVAEGAVHRIRRCYPVYRRGYREHLQVVVEYLKTLSGISPIGRYGSFKYNNQDHSILMGLLVADTLCHDADHDLWQVNEDDQYQEQGQSTHPHSKHPVLSSEN